MPRRRAITPADPRAAAVAWQIATASASDACSVLDVDAEDELHHPLDLRLLRAAVAADGLLDVGGRVLSGRDAGGCAGDEHGPARLPDRERDAGVGADERLLQRHRIRGVLGDEPGHPVEDRLEAKILALPGAAWSSTRGTVALRRPSLSWTMPYPHAAVPGSMPRTFTRTR